MKFFAYFWLVLFTFVGCAHKSKPVPRDIASLKANGGMSGIWFLQGTSSTRGPYNGELELRQASDGTFDVIRVVTYINYFFDGLRVQEVWTGKAVANEDTLTISYDLLQGEFIVKMGSQSKVGEHLDRPLTVVAQFLPSPSGLTSKFSDKKVSEYSEWLTTKEPLKPDPLWKNEIKIVNAQSGLVPAAVRKNIRQARKYLNYDKDPFIQKYKDRSEYRDEKAVRIFDPTDYQFYKTNNDVIRVENKVTDDLTITESILKRNAFFPALSDKAAGFEGQAFRASNTTSGLIASSETDPDAAFITSMYLATQAIRYQAVKDPAALANVKKVLKNLTVVIDTYDGPERFWPALIHGLIWSASVTSQKDMATWKQLQMMVEKIDTRKDITLSGLGRSSLEGLKALLFEDSDAFEKFMKTTSAAKQHFYWNGTADWENEFRTLIETTNHIQLAILLGDQDKAEEWRKYLLVDWGVYAPAHRALRTLATYAFAPRESALGQEFLDAIKEAVWTLREFPYPHSQLDITIDHSGKSQWTVSPIPNNFWTVKGKNPGPVQNYYQGLQQVPIYQLSGVVGKFLWAQDGFQYRGTASSKEERFGVDYLYAYWLAKLAGVSDVP